MNPYTIAFTIGYFYGRAYSTDSDVTLPEADMVHKTNRGFTDGLQAGRRDFQAIDLPIAAMAQEQVDPL